MPERNFTHDSSVPNRADPIAAPIINCAMVPTTISDSAVEIRNQIESRLAISARPNHNAASAQTPVICKSPACQCRHARLPIRDEAMLWRSRLVLRTRTHDVFRRCGQDAQDQQGCDELRSGFEYKRKHRRDGDCDENGDREAVICQKCAHTKFLIRPRVTCPRGLLGRTGKLSAWCRGNWASSYRRQASGRSHQPHRRLRGTPSPGMLNSSEEMSRGKIKEAPLMQSAPTGRLRPTTITCINENDTSAGCRAVKLWILSWAAFWIRAFADRVASRRLVPRGC